MTSNKVKSNINLKSKVWVSDTGYYEQAKQASLRFVDHTAYKTVNKFLQNSKSILDIGCGEGTKLNLIGNKNAQKTGIDVSQDAINTAQIQYPQLNFRMCDIEELPFQNNTFEASFSAFVMEHLDNPKQFISEMIRVTKKKGLIIIICPNFGSPNRNSPCFIGSKVLKLLIGLIREIIMPSSLTVSNWKKVVPLSKGYKHISDYDTTVEPEIISLINFMRSFRLEILKWSSLWEEEIPEANKIQFIFSSLARFDIYPFKFWGPQLLVIARKI